MVALFLYRFIAYIILIFIASVPFYLQCKFLKSEADIVEVTVMEVLNSFAPGYGAPQFEHHFLRGPHGAPHFESLSYHVMDII